ncbi:hypothetical protein WAI453_006415 [Rhynchosporium graminicola]
MTGPAKPSYAIVPGRQDTNAKDAKARGALKEAVKRASALLGVILRIALLLPLLRYIRNRSLDNACECFEAFEWEIFHLCLVFLQLFILRYAYSPVPLLVLLICASPLPLVQCNHGNILLHVFIGYAPSTPLA